MAIGLLAALAGVATTQANDALIVVTDSRNPVRAPAGARVIELDQAERIRAELSADLPGDPARAALLARQRLEAGGVELQRRIGQTYQDVADAWAMGVTTLPAVIVDRRYVVYGESEVAKAVALIEAHRRKQP